MVTDAKKKIKTKKKEEVFVILNVLGEILKMIFISRKKETDFLRSILNIQKSLMSSSS